MAELSEITNIKEAKAYIIAFTKPYLRHDNPILRTLSFLIHSLADLYRTVRTPEGYQSHKITLAYAVESLSRQSRPDAFTFAPCIFLLIKFDFSISEDPESSDIVRYRLLNSLAFSFELPTGALTITQIKSHHTYIHFLDYVVKLARTIDDGPVPSQPPDSHFTPAAALRDVSLSLPQDLEDRAAALDAIHRDYRMEMVPLLQPVINARIQRVVGSSLEEKRNVAKVTNEQLRNCGLSIRCEIKDKVDPTIIKGVYPSYLIADPSKAGDEIGRFRLEYTGEDGKPRRVVHPSESESISLMLAPMQHAVDLAPIEPRPFADRVKTASRRSR